MGIESICVVTNFAQAFDSILAAKAIRGRGKSTIGKWVEDLANEVDDSVGAGTEFTYNLEIRGRRLAVAGRNTGDVDKLNRFPLEQEPRADYVALTEGILDEGTIA